MLPRAPGLTQPGPLFALEGGSATASATVDGDQEAQRQAVASSSELHCLGLVCSSVVLLADWSWGWGEQYWLHAGQQEGMREGSPVHAPVVIITVLMPARELVG